jgi:uncharacterized membrane protein
MDFLRDFRAFVSAAGKQRVAEAIAAAEEKTSGEIHVHIMKLAPPRDMLLVAERAFHALGLHETTGRNGVLILISKGDRRFAIWGDKGIHEKAGQVLWDKAKAALASHLREGRNAEGLIAAVEAVGAELAKHFPPTGPRKNELSDQVSEV